MKNDRASRRMSKERRKEERRLLLTFICSFERFTLIPRWPYIISTFGHGNKRNMQILIFAKFHIALIFLLHFVILCASLSLILTFQIGRRSKAFLPSCGRRTIFHPKTSLQLNVLLRFLGYSITISMKDVLDNPIIYTHQFIPLQVRLASSCTQGETILTRLKFHW